MWYNALMPGTQTHNDKNKELSTKTYDLIMAVIEPDLVSDRLPVLDIFYTDESPEAHEARMARYKRAYAQCEKVIAKLEITLQEEMQKARKLSGQKTQQAEQDEKDGQIRSVERLINSPDDDA